MSKRSAALRKPSLIAWFSVPVLGLAALVTLPSSDRVDSVGTVTSRVVRAELGCPELAGSQPRVSIAGLAEGSESAATLRSAGQVFDFEINRPALSSVAISSGAVITARGDLAPGLVASSIVDGATAPCVSAVPDGWVVGLGAGPTHNSVLELINPDPAPAVVDVSLWSESGEQLRQTLRGRRVDGNSRVQISLAQSYPLEGALAARVVTARGRVMPFVTQVYDDLGAAKVQRALSPLTSPGRANVLFGLGKGPGQRTITLVNPSARAAQVSFEILTSGSRFASADLPALVLDPGEVRVIEVGELLAREARSGALAVAVNASRPIVASLLSRSSSQTQVAANPEMLPGLQALVIGPGARRLLLEGAKGVVDVRVLDARGTELLAESVRTQLSGISVIQLPVGAALITAEARDTTIRAVVLSSTSGPLALQSARLVSRTPRVQPGPPQ